MARTVKAAEFKQACLALMDDVAKGGPPIVITKRGKPVAKLVAPVESRAQTLGCLKGMLEVVDDDFSLPKWTVSARKAR
ncbi:MAG TPA: type II toxin-antitoxin system Phd/YefM family antitoxin [Labilithrix sp.]|nr:type II toxin-antitoxin system Phd/YefM family antitoxin [Labilithrix sp.]